MKTPPNAEFFYVFLLTASQFAYFYRHYCIVALTLSLSVKPFFRGHWTRFFEQG